MANTRVAQADILQRYMGNNGGTMPTNWYIGFFNGPPSNTGTAYTYELTASQGGYSRTLVANTTGEWEWELANFRIKNVNDITCCTATADWGTGAQIQYVGLFDASTLGTGNLWFYEALTTPKTIQSGTTIIFKAGAFLITNPGT